MTDTPTVRWSVMEEVSHRRATVHTLKRGSGEALS
jgi:hypothetical protein